MTASLYQDGPIEVFGIQTTGPQVSLGAPAITLGNVGRSQDEDSMPVGSAAGPASDGIPWWAWFVFVVVLLLILQDQ